MNPYLYEEMARYRAQDLERELESRRLADSRPMSVLRAIGRLRRPRPAAVQYVCCCCGVVA